MHKNYIITAHKNPEQLQRLVLTLNDGASTFYIHINASVELEPFKKHLDYSFVKFISKRVHCIWGNFGLVQAVINSLKEIVLDSKEEGICIWLTGQDYPIKSNQTINSFLDKNADSDFIDSNPIKEVWPNHWRKRIEYYRFNYSENQRDYVLIPNLFSWQFLKYCPASVYKILLLLGHKTPAKKLFGQICKQRKHPKGLNPFGGAGWWALRTNTIKKMLDFIDKNQSFVAYHHHTHAPDEIFFQTIIQELKKTDETIKIQPLLTYVKWGEANTTSPITFTAADYSKFENIEKGKLFARKFDIDLDTEILDLIDKKISEEGAPEAFK